MTSNILLDELLNKAQIDYKTYTNLPGFFKRYIENCVHFNIQNGPHQIKAGDIVIRTLWDLGNKPKIIDTDHYGVTIKWRVVAVSYGLVVGRKLLGKRLGQLEVVNNPNIAGSKAEIDPEYLDSIIMDDKNFNPNAKRDANMKMRRIASKYNKSISQKISNTEESLVFMDSLSVGTRLYIARSLIGLTTSAAVVDVVAAVDENNSWPKVTLSSSKFGYQSNLTTRMLVDTYVTDKEPFPLSQLISE